MVRRGKKYTETKKQRFGEEDRIENRPEEANNRERLGDWES